MNLRKIANHPLLIRNHFDEGQVRQLAKLLKKDASHEKAVEKFIAEDLSVMSDFDIHKTCLEYKVSSFNLSLWLLQFQKKFSNPLLHKYYWNWVTLS